LTVQSCSTGIAAANPGLAKFLFAAIFPCGLYMTIMTGVDLFTGNTMKMPAAVIEKKVTMNQLWKNWFWSYFGNFVGSLALVAMVAYSGVLAGAALPIKTAVYKSSLTWGQVSIEL
jgi:formate/nitrite transporter FocA (FNT family)